MLLDDIEVFVEVVDMGSFIKGVKWFSIFLLIVSFKVV